MARIFNIYFYFNDSQHNAMVSVRTTPFYTEYTLKFYEEQLLQLLPGNKIISPSPRQFLFPNATPQNCTKLMNILIQAVQDHLHSVTIATNSSRE